MKTCVRILLAATLASAMSAASAHAFLDHADPRVGSTVHTAPSQVRLWFTERLEPAFSTAEVADETGKRIESARAKVDGADPRLMQIDVPPLEPGRYTVKWRVLSVDTHLTQGNFSFTVAR